MNLDQARERFVHTWGKLGSDWGINRTMAQIHALLLISEELLSTDDIMEELTISRGNANMNVRTLVEWRLIYRELKAGERKDFFRAEKDLWLVSQRIADLRRKKELDPLMRELEEIASVNSCPRGREKELKAFKKTVSDILSLGKKAGGLLDMVLRFDQPAFFKPILRMLK